MSLGGKLGPARVDFGFALVEFPCSPRWSLMRCAVSSPFAWSGTLDRRGEG